MADHISLNANFIYIIAERTRSEPSTLRTPLRIESNQSHLGAAFRKTLHTRNAEERLWVDFICPKDKCDETNIWGTKHTQYVTGCALSYSENEPCDAEILRLSRSLLCLRPDLSPARLHGL